MPQSNAERQRKWRQRRKAELNALRREVHAVSQNPAAEAMSALADGDGARAIQALNRNGQLAGPEPVLGAADIFAHLARHCNVDAVARPPEGNVDADQLHFLLALGRLLNSLQSPANERLATEDVLQLLHGLARTQASRRTMTAADWRAGNSETSLPQVPIAPELLDSVAKILAGEPLDPDEAARILESGLDGGPSSDFAR